MTGTEINKVKAYIALKRDRGYRYCVFWKVGKSPQMVFAKTWEEALTSFNEARAIADIVTMEVIVIGNQIAG